MFLLTGSPKTRVPALRNQLCRGAFLITEKTSRVRGEYNRIKKIQKGFTNWFFYYIIPNQKYSSFTRLYFASHHNSPFQQPTEINCVNTINIRNRKARKTIRGPKGPKRSNVSKTTSSQVTRLGTKKPEVPVLKAQTSPEGFRPGITFKESRGQQETVNLDPDKTCRNNIRLKFLAHFPQASVSIREVQWDDTLVLDEEVISYGKSEVRITFLLMDKDGTVVGQVHKNESLNQTIVKEQILGIKYAVKITEKRQRIEGLWKKFCFIFFPNDPKYLWTKVLVELLCHEGNESFVTFVQGLKKPETNVEDDENSTALLLPITATTVSAAAAV